MESSTSSAGVRPAISLHHAADLAARLFGLQPSLAVDEATSGATTDNSRELDSYADRNFLLQLCCPAAGSQVLEAGGLEGSTCSSAAQPQQVVLKMHNSWDSTPGAMQALEGQCQAMKHLAQTGILCPTPIPSITGRLIEVVELPHPITPGCQHRHAVRCFNYIPGRVLGHEQHVPLPVYASLGAFMGRVSKSLASFHHPGLEHVHPWCYEVASATITSKLETIGDLLDARQRSLVQWALQQWQRAQPLILGLRRQVCHADANDMNVLLNHDATQVAALLDFGDMCHTYAAAELAITLAYAMLLEVSLQQRQGGTQQQAAGGDAEGERLVQAAYAAGRAVVEGYLKSCPLSQDELAALPVLVGMRVALSVVVGAASAQADPDNVAYLLLTQKPGWLMLGALQQHDLSTSLGLDRLCC